ncbi:hypothetical protein V8F20_000739 [Naviculisporaceae sp. PSN 640]
MPPALKLTAPAPSRNLLLFLRAQSEGVAFFAPSRGPDCIINRTCVTAQQQRRNAGTAAGRRPKLSSTTAVSKARSMTVTREYGSLTTGPHILDHRTVIDRSIRKQRATSKVPAGVSVGGARRYNSSESKTTCEEKRPKWREWLFGPGDKKGRLGPKEKDDILSIEEQTGSIFPRRALTAKAALDPRLRCTEVDGNGDVIMVDGELKKSELIAKYGLLPRDLRKIDSSNLPHILVRPSAILLNLLHLKVLIKHDRVLLFDVYGSKTSYPQSAFMYDLQGKLQTKQAPGANSLPYEFRALEAVLMSVTSELEADFESVRDPVIHILSELEDDIDRDKLRILLGLSKKVSTFEQKAKLVRDAIEELLEADDDLAAMYLTEKTHDLFRGEDDHTEIELLLESYNKICDEVAQEAGNLVSSIRNTEEIIRAILDANRNSLMLLDLKFSVGTLGLAMGTFLAGLYGMNLENFIEETNWGFGAVTAVSSFFSLLVCWYGLVKLRKVQRVKISGGARGHWFREDPTDALLDPSNRERLRRINMMKNSVKQKPKKPFGLF